MKTQIPEGYATIRRSKGRAKNFNMNDRQNFEMININLIKPKTINMSANHHENSIYGGDGIDDKIISELEIDSDILPNKNCDKMSYYGENNQQTFKTFKSTLNNFNHSSTSICSTTTKNLTESCDLLMTPLKSPQYINQLNATRYTSKYTLDNCNPAAANQQFPLYSRPKSPNKLKTNFSNNRSTSPSVESIDNCSSNSSSTHAPAYKNSQQIPSTLTNSDENLILIENGFKRPPPKKPTTLSYRKSFSHIQNRTHYINGENNVNHYEYRSRKHNGNLMNVEAISQECINNYDNNSNEKPSISTVAMTTKPLVVVPSASTSNLYTQHRYATLAHPKEKFRTNSVNTKSTSSLNESHFFWNPIVLESKIGSQTTLRPKPAIPWWEIACKKEYRQSCPPLKVIIKIFFNFYHEV